MAVSVNWGALIESDEVSGCFQRVWVDIGRFGGLELILTKVRGCFCKLGGPY